MDLLVIRDVVMLFPTSKSLTSQIVIYHVRTTLVSGVVTSFLVPKFGLVFEKRQQRVGGSFSNVALPL